MPTCRPKSPVSPPKQPDRFRPNFGRSMCASRCSYPPFSASRALTPRRSAYSINASSMTAVTERRSDAASCSARASTDGSKRVVNGFFVIVAFRLESGVEKCITKHVQCTCIARAAAGQSAGATLIGLTTTKLSGVRVMADSDDTTTLPSVPQGLFAGTAVFEGRC